MHALLLVDHGSRRPEAHDHLEELSRRVRDLAPETRVRIAHLELADPSVPAALAELVREGVREVTVVPLFLLPGRHLSVDLPQLLERASDEHEGLVLHLSSAVGEHPDLARLVLSCARG